MCFEEGFAVFAGVAHITATVGAVAGVVVFNDEARVVEVGVAEVGVGGVGVGGVDHVPEHTVEGRCRCKVVPETINNFKY